MNDLADAYQINLGLSSDPNSQFPTAAMRVVWMTFLLVVCDGIRQSHMVLSCGLWPNNLRKGAAAMRFRSWTTSIRKGDGRMCQNDTLESKWVPTWHGH